MVRGFQSYGYALDSRRKPSLSCVIARDTKPHTPLSIGAHLTLFFQCFELLWGVRRRQPKFAYTCLVYISLLSIFCSIGAGCSFRVNQQAFVDYRNFPGGPAQYTLLGFNKLNILGPSAYMVCSWLQDGLLVRACRSVHQIKELTLNFNIVVSFLYHLRRGCLADDHPHTHFYIFNRSVLLYPYQEFPSHDSDDTSSSLVFSCLLISQIALPGATLWAPGNLAIVLGFGSTTCATTLLLSGLIVARLIYTRYQLKKAMGRDELAPYLTVSAMIIESAALYVVTALTFMITYAADSSVSYLIYGFLGQAPVSSVILYSLPPFLTRTVFYSVDRALVNH